MLRLDTWKKTTIGEIDYHWSNTYYLDNAHLHSFQFDLFWMAPMRVFTLYESYLHTQAVTYTHITVYDIEGDLTQGASRDPFEGNLHGYWDLPTPLAPWDVVKRAAFWTTLGRPRSLFLRCSLRMQDLAYTDKGHLCLPTIKSWDSGFQNTVANWFAYYPRETFYVRHNTRGGGPVAYNNPVKWCVTGASELHAIDRAQARYMGNGLDYFERSLAATQTIANLWHDFSQGVDYHSPQNYTKSYYNRLLNAGGDLLSLLNSAKDYFSTSTGGGTGGGHITRYPPTADDIADACQTAINTINGDLDQLNQIHWNGDPANQWCDDADEHKMLDACQHWDFQTAFLPSLDWRTPLSGG